MRFGCRKFLRLSMIALISLGSFAAKAQSFSSLGESFASGAVSFTRNNFSKRSSKTGTIFSNEYVILSKEDALRAKELGFQSDTYLVATALSNQPVMTGVMIGLRSNTNEKLEKLLAGKPKCNLEVFANTIHEDRATPQMNRGYKITPQTKPRNPQDFVFDIQMPRTADGQVRMAALSCPKDLDYSLALESLKSQGLNLGITTKDQANVGGSGLQNPVAGRLK